MINICEKPASRLYRLARVCNAGLVKTHALQMRVGLFEIKDGRVGMANCSNDK